jgi:hypothetical protein
MNELIQFSKTESEILNLKIGRCNLDYFDENKLKQEIFTGSYDVCRVKVNAEDEYVVSRLEQLGFPYYFSGSIRRYKTPIEQKHQTDLIHPDMDFMEYSSTYENDLFQLLKDTWGDYPIGYYRTPIINQFCNKDNEIQSVFQFYKENNLPSKNPNNSIMLMRHKGLFVGFFALNKVKNHLESHIGGILKKHQKEGYFFDMLAYIKNYCLQNNLSHFVFGARNENAKVQKIFHAAGFIPVGSENVFHIVSLLNKLDSEKQKIDENTFDRSKAIKIMNVFFKDHIISEENELSILNINIGENSTLIVEKCSKNYGVFNRISYLWDADNKTQFL